MKLEHTYYLKTVPLLVQGKLEPIKQDEEKVTFAYNIKREQEKINWAKTGEEVYNHIRGLNPWPVAYTTLAGQVVKVWWGEKVPTANDAQPGTIVEIQEDGFIVVTGNETGIKITELQPAGKKTYEFFTIFTRGKTGDWYEVRRRCMRQNVRELALDGLMQVEKSGAYSNLLLNHLIEKSTIHKKDIGLLTEIVYGTIQRRDTLDYYLQPFLRKKVDAWVRVLLRLSLYQMLYLDRVPERVAIHEAVEIAKRRGHKGIAGMVNGVLRSIQREGVPSLDELKDPVERLAIAMSHPTWLVQEWVVAYGLETAEKMCEVNMLPPVPTARVNVDKITVEEAIDLLNQEGVEAKRGDLSDDAIQIEKGNVAHTEAFQKGFLSIQDESSMLVARAVEPSKGDMILDSCSLLAEKQRIWQNDYEELVRLCLLIYMIIKCA